MCCAQEREKGNNMANENQKNRNNTGSYYQKGFVKVNSVNLENDQVVEEYFSLNSGMRIILSNKIKSPKLYGFFTLITEAENSEGLPHALEHLIFLGSRKYPYKGVLDLFSYKCLSEGTNAWTATDHTCYIIETVGIEGFSSILPVYLDFILNPTLEDEFFISEVHHIYEQGEHSGVLYSEMKSVENKCSTIIERTLYTNLFPNEKSSYRFETGGTLEGIRATNNNRVKEYFKRFYKLDNFVAIIFGNFENEIILDVLHAFEEYHLNINPEQRRKEKIVEITESNVEMGLNAFLKHLQNPDRPWRKPENMERRKDSKIIKTYYPSNKLDNGQVTIAWRGCQWNEFKTKLAIDLICSYLTDLTTSPLGKKLLDGEKSYCADVGYDQEDQCDLSYTIDIYDVPYKGYEWKKAISELSQEKKETKQEISQTKNTINKTQNKNEKNIVTAMDIVGEMSRECLQEVYNNELNMDQLRSIVNRCYLKHLKNMELCPQSTLIDYLVKYAIYGIQLTDFENSVNHKKFYRELLNEEETYWKKILKTYFIDNDYVEVKCYPSPKKAKQLELFEKNLKEEEQKKYGDEKLKEMVEQVKQIVQAAKQLPPAEAFDVIPFADPKKVFIPSVLLFRNFEDTDGNVASKQAQQTQQTIQEYVIENEHKNELFQKIGNKLSQINFPLQMNHVYSSMVLINVFININCVSDELKPFIPLLSYLLYESNITVNGNNIESDAFLSELIKRTISYGNDVGLYGNARNFKSEFLPNVFYVNILGLVNDYKDLFDLLFLAMFNMNIDKKRLNLIMKSSYQHMLRHKTEPKTLISNLHYFLRYLKNGNTSFISLGKQESILKMKEKDYDYIISKLNELKKVLFDPNNFVITIDANFEKLSDCFAWHDRWFTRDAQGKYKILDPKITIFDAKENNESDRFATVMDETAHHSEKKNDEQNINTNMLDEKHFIDDSTGLNTASIESENSKKLGNRKNPPPGYIALGKRTHKSLKKWLNTELENEDKNFKENIVNNKACNGIICETPSTDVSRLLLTVKISAGYEHEDHPELVVLSEYLSMTEGPLYRNVRGGGYAYGVSCRLDSFMGELTLEISAASDIISALKESFNVFESIYKTKLTEEQLLLAKYSAYYTIFDKQETVNDRLMQSVKLGLLNINLNYYDELVNKINNVTVDSFHKVMKKYMTKFFQFKVDEHNAVNGSTLCIICASGKMEQIKQALKEELKIGEMLSLQISQLYKLLKTYDLESVIKGDEDEEKERKREPFDKQAERTNQKSNKEQKERDGQNEQSQSHSESEGEDEGDVFSENDMEGDSECESGASVNLTDDSYPGYSDI